MGSRASCTRLALLLASGLLLVAACGDKEPCPGVVDGASYEVDIESQAAVDLASDCYQDWGLADGSTFTARVTSITGDGSCLVGVPELESVQGWTLTKQRTEVTSEGFLEGMYQGRFDACSALVSLELSKRGEGMPCFDSGSSTSAQCLLTLHFQPQGAGCPAPCTAFLTTTVTRQ
jgi:hypothetical protein